ncbi:protein NLRC3 isoform X1 [Oryzias melastigma]|uniref:protein NLRC3 isoform X1 n=1 Tax=Oryzias melastigma TaxID=30732 RepID=UPI000CF80ED0|nr:protein NLRC3 isoform X1 [Oryzias melastigma]
MDSTGEQQTKVESSASSCVSMRSDQSRDNNPFFSNENEQQRGQQLTKRIQSSASSDVSMRSNQSRDNNPFFSSENEQQKGQELKQRVQSSASSCVSMRSDQSRDNNPFFGAEDEPKGQQLKQRVQSSASSCVSMRSDQSRDNNPFFSSENEQQRKRRTDVCDEELLSCCSLCQEVLRNPVSTICGHWYCRQCITSYWDQSDPSGLCSCPQCGEKSGRREGLQTISQNRTAQSKTEHFLADVGLQELLDEHQISVKRRHENASEGTDDTGRETPLKKIYTELYITARLREEVHSQHEVRQLETACIINSPHDVPVRCHDIFKVLTDQHGPIRVVLTSGVAGVGKTFLVQKFTLDWAEGLENQDISAVIPLSFREMNLIRDEQHSLLTLIQVFYPTFQKITAEQLSVCKLLFIFDGLDESRLSLDFNNSQVVSDVTQKSSINVLLTNLIQGHLLPSALIWITSRPAATNQIPPSCVSRVTEVRGFTDSQKEEYFRRRFSDEDLSSRVFSHIKASKSLFIMCRVPVFCWITAVVLEHMMATEKIGDLPTTMTDLYSHFLIVQTKRKKNKYQQEHEENPQELTEADMDVLLKLGRLAFEHLEKGNIMFYQEDLEQCGLDVTEASLYSGVCTEIFRRECEIFQKAVYCFVHLSVQEFLAAVYMIHCYNNNKSEVVETFLLDQTENSSSNKSSLTLIDFLSNMLKKSLQSQNGHLDLFVRFLHGLCEESNQRLLGSLLGQAENSPEDIQTVVDNLKKMKTCEINPDRGINIFQCLMEMKDFSVHQEMLEFLKSMNPSGKNLSEMHCSAMAYMLQMSEEVVDELDLNKFNTTPLGRIRLIPAVRNCMKFRFNSRSLVGKPKDSPCPNVPEPPDLYWDIVASALKSNPSHLTEMDLSGSNLHDLAVKYLCEGLESPNCKLEVLRLKNCRMSKVSCDLLVSTVKSNPSHLTELDLSKNNLQRSDVQQLIDLLQSPDSKLETLRWL